ncbi:TrkH family potassium uptake protein [Xenophilus arseniciresistens]|uniref:Trk system potassium uptake protein n=1 Tax=Xenophilus arseniciresistens TaxID=1283306 RepID=A0AAE3NE90_9BURK|nr:potassium transporter TrkG [Xenophilus arseniciresistens]MDA7418677.1 TrkH family potassium uptake protein [Xenophilus arseniciresistens]
MSDLLPVLRLLGALTTMFSLALLLPAAVSWVHEDGLLGLWLGAAGVSFGGGAWLWAGLHAYRSELRARHGVILVSATWLVLPLVACVPLMMSFHALGRELDFSYAYFEAVSGLTTSGATVLQGLDSLPMSINVWRTFLQWIGGMGILVLAVAVLPMFGMGGSQMFRAEVAGPIKDSRLTPRITQTAKGLWGIYVVLSVSCFFAYWLGGMTVMDALMHMFSTVSLGGLSSHDASFAYFDSPLLEAIAMVFMLAGSGSFALYFVAIRKRSLRICWRDIEWRATMLTLLGGSVIVSLVLVLQHNQAPLQAVRHGFFNTISIASTTGYASQDFLLWPAFAPLFLLLLSGVATSAGSAGCGIKMVRVLILLKQARREMTRLAHPRAVQPVTLGPSIVEHRDIFAVLAFMLVYGGTIVVLGMAMVLSGLDPVTAFSAVIASVNCMGPGLGEVGPAAHFGVLTDFQIWVCTIAMVLGRLEMLSLIALLTPSFWRH